MVDVAITAREGGDYGGVGGDTNPVVTLLGPASSVPFGGVFVIQVSAVDDRGVASIQLYRNASLVATYQGPGLHSFNDTANVDTTQTWIYSAFAVDINDNASTGKFVQVLIDGDSIPWARFRINGQSLSTVYGGAGDDPVTGIFETLDGAPMPMVPVTSSEPAVVTVSSRTGLDGSATLRFLGRGVATLIFRGPDPENPMLTREFRQRVVVGAPSGRGGRVSSMQVLSLDSTGVLNMRIGDAPAELQIVDQLGLALPTAPKASVQVTEPSRVSVPASISKGEMPVAPVSEGLSTIRVSYDDPVNGVVVLDIPVMVWPEANP